MTLDTVPIVNFFDCKCSIRRHVRTHFPVDLKIHTHLSIIFTLSNQMTLSPSTSSSERFLRLCDTYDSSNNYPRFDVLKY